MNTAIYNEDFNWEIGIPENFHSVTSQEWAKIQNRGLEVVEDSFGEIIEYSSKTVFVFHNNPSNYFEASYQLFDPTVNGSYLENIQTLNEGYLEMFSAQMPGVIVDNELTTEVIDDLEFYAIRLKIKYPNNRLLYAHVYCRLFEEKDLSINIMYEDKQKGLQMLEVWRNSTFGKPNLHIA